PVEAHIYARGGHAFNMGNRSKLATLKNWPQRMTDWLGDNYILDPSQRTRDEERQKALQNQKEVTTMSPTRQRGRNHARSVSIGTFGMGEASGLAGASGSML
ncbi:MAG TPA: hypothetical protein VGP68_04405, partial [Gemmataceae bacterium]|nr:hypothetical protein [Gemmataceae bacterium]